MTGPGGGDEPAPERRDDRAPERREDPAPERREPPVDVVSGPPPSPGRRERGRTLLVRTNNRLVRYGLLAVLVLLGPLLATATVLVLAPGEPAERVLPTPETPLGDGIEVTFTVERVDAGGGNAGLVVEMVPRGRYAQGPELARSLSVLLNTGTGPRAFELGRGTVVSAMRTELALRGSRIDRYPLDRYDTGVAVLVIERGEGLVGVPMAVQMVNRSSEFDLELVGGVQGDPLTGNVSFAVQVRRPGDVLLWSLFFVVIVWSLALAAMSVSWVVVLQGNRVPFWSWGFYTSVLFALPPLRTSLPGSPPLGSLIDWAAFYWALALVALSLLASMLAWNTDVRDAVERYG